MVAHSSINNTDIGFGRAFMDNSLITTPNRNLTARVGGAGFLARIPIAPRTVRGCEGLLSIGINRVRPAPARRMSVREGFGLHGRDHTEVAAYPTNRAVAVMVSFSRVFQQPRGAGGFDTRTESLGEFSHMCVARCHGASSGDSKGAGAARGGLAQACFISKCHFQIS